MDETGDDGALTELVRGAITPKALSDLLGWSRQRLHRFFREGVVERGANGLVPHPEGLQALVNHLSELAAGRGGSAGQFDLTAQCARLAHAQAAAVEFKNAIAAGEFVPAADVEQRWGDVLSAIRSRMLAIPSNLPQALPHLTRADLDVIDREIRDGLTELADNLGAPERTGPTMQT